MHIKGNIYLSIVIPAFNEEKRIGKTLEEIISYLKTKDFENEIIVVNDGSTDSTVEIVKRYDKTAHRLTIIENAFTMGKGYSVRRGMLESKGDFVLFTDADLSTPISEVDKLFIWLGKGYDVAIGSRSMKGSQVEIYQSVIRRSMGKVFNKIMKLIVFTDYKDTQCGFKCFKRHVVDNVFRRQKIEGFAFDVEILLIARQQGFSIKETPVRWLNSPYSKVRIINDSFLMLYDLFKIRFYDLTKSYY